MQERAVARAKALYDFIDESNGYYVAPGVCVRAQQHHLHDITQYYMCVYI
jgi:hypothetical protein